MKINKRLKLFFYPLLLFVFALSAGRVYFLFQYFDAFDGSGIVPIIKSLLWGLRFDLSAAATMAAPFVLLLFLPVISRSKAYVKWLLYLLFAWFIALIVFDFIDIQYYDFTERHITYELANTWQDTPVILKIGVKRYLPEMAGLLIFIVLFGVAFLKLLKGAIPEHENSGGARTLFKEALMLLVVVALSVVFIRGGFQRKSLSAINAFRDENVELGNLSLNGIFTAFGTVYRMGIYKKVAEGSLARLSDEDRKEVLGFMLSENEENSPDYPLYRRFPYQPSERKGLNVVIIIMESWSAKYMASLGGSPKATPFFDELSKEGLLVNCTANAQRSFRGLAAILGSIPVYEGTALGHETLLYQTRMEPIGKVFKDLGYETLFIHGAPPSSMRLDGLIKRLGMERHISRDDFGVTKKTDDGVWGIFDEYVFSRAHEEFEKLEKPFFGVIFSLTSHSPYTVPSDEFKYFDPSVPYNDFLNTVRYADHSLKLFFDKARSSAYFNNTLFIITADHTEGANTRDNIYNAYAVPCLFLSPGRISPGKYDMTASHLDIVPSIMDFLNVSSPYTAWGKSIFGGGERRAMLGWGGDMFVWVDRPYMLLSDLNSVRGLYDYSKDPSVNIMEKEPAIANRLHGELLKYTGLSKELITENRLMPQ